MNRLYFDFENKEDYIITRKLLLELSRDYDTSVILNKSLRLCKIDKENKIIGKENGNYNINRRTF